MVICQAFGAMILFFLMAKFKVGENFRVRMLTLGGLDHNDKEHVGRLIISLLMK
jgi:hypothetical protein